MSSLAVRERISDTVGNTPMVRLSDALVGSTGDNPAEVFAKIEFLNPMGSIKDRLARFLVDKALADGRLGAGGTLVEASSGNTAMGLAMMAAERGLRCKMVVRRSTSAEKLACLEAMGVELVLVDGELPPEHPESYNRKALEVAAQTADAFFPDQHNNRENNEAHYRTTGPELWQQMDGRIDILVCGIGTGGTISGVGRYLKERDRRVRVVAVDVVGSVFTEHFRTGRHGRPRLYRLEGLGDEEIIGCPEFEVIDEMLQVSDRAAFLAAREMARTSGIFAGGSSGAALWGVRQVVRTLEGPARIATLFPDHGSRYVSTIYDDAWMRRHGYLD